MHASHLHRAVVAAVLAGATVGCHDLAGTQLPSGTQDPSYYNSAAGAIGMRNAAIYAFDNALPNYIISTGLLTDELADLSTLSASLGSQLSNGGTVTDPLDERILPELPYGATGSYASDGTYAQLQGVRTALSQALGQLAVSDTAAKDTALLSPAVNRVLRGELYALYGYAELMLADLFCSGVPLSTFDFQHDFTYHAGSSTQAVYQEAIAKFDTAVALSVDSARIQYLALVGLGRAYLDVGKAAAAADDVSTVPTDYTYQQSAYWGSGHTGGCSATCNKINDLATVADGEGRNGFLYASSGDPRTRDTTFSAYNTAGNQSYMGVGYPMVYLAGLTGTAYAPVTIASGVEARLIEAEAALQPGGAGVNAWLTLLNDLRHTAPMPGTATPQPSLLPDLSDPGTDSARLALTFRERAAWLYLTGRRQSDLRRELRQYPRYWRGESNVYPTGTYLGLGAGNYGSDVNAPIPSDEYINPLFKGCLNRDP